MYKTFTFIEAITKYLNIYELNNLSNTCKELNKKHLIPDHIKLIISNNKESYQRAKMFYDCAYGLYDKNVSELKESKLEQEFNKIRTLTKEDGLFKIENNYDDEFANNIEIEEEIEYIKYKLTYNHEIRLDNEKIKMLKYMYKTKYLPIDFLLNENCINLRNIQIEIKLVNQNKEHLKIKYNTYKNSINITEFKFLEVRTICESKIQASNSNEWNEILANNYNMRMYYLIIKTKAKIKMFKLITNDYSHIHEIDEILRENDMYIINFREGVNLSRIDRVRCMIMYETDKEEDLKVYYISGNIMVPDNGYYLIKYG